MTWFPRAAISPRLGSAGVLRRTGALLVGACTALVVAAGVLPIGAWAQDKPLSWSEAIKVSTPIPDQVDWWPAVAADDQGNVQIIWNTTQFDDGIGSKHPDAAGQLAYVRWDGHSWSPQSDLALIWYGYALRTSIVTDASGRLHLIFKGWGDLSNPPGLSGQDLFYMSAPGPEAGAYTAWSQPVQINRGPLAYYPVIQLDSHGTLHAIWSETDSTGKFGLYYARSTTGGASWSDRVVLQSDEPVWWYRPQMKIDDRDRIHVVYELGGQDSNTNGLRFGVTRGAVYLESLDGGQTWVRHEFLGVANTQAGDDASMVPGPQQPAIGVDGNGNVLMIYREARRNRIVFRESADGTLWSGPVALPGVTGGVDRPYDIYDTATDSAGHVHLVAIGYPNGSTAMSVLHFQWNGETWSQPDILMSGPPYPEYPRLAIGEGNRLHAVWFAGDKATTSRTPVGIWYSTAVADSPRQRSFAGRVPPALMSRVEGVRPSPTSVTVPIPTPASLPAASRASYDGGRNSLASGSSVSDLPIFPVAAALIPAVLAIAVFLISQLRQDTAIGNIRNPSWWERIRTRGRV